MFVDPLPSTHKSVEASAKVGNQCHVFELPACGNTVLDDVSGAFNDSASNLTDFSKKVVNVVTDCLATCQTNILVSKGLDEQK